VRGERVIVETLEKEQANKLQETHFYHEDARKPGGAMSVELYVMKMCSEINRVVPDFWNVDLARI
jgi:hypothetical protein